MLYTPPNELIGPCSLVTKGHNKMIYFLTFSCKSSYSNNYETPEGTFPFKLFIRTEIKTRKLERKSKQQTSRLNDLLSRLIDLVSLKR